MEEQDQNPGRISTYEKPASAVGGVQHPRPGGTSKKKKRPMQIRVRVYFGDVDDPQEFEQVIREAEAAKCRRPGLPALIQGRGKLAGQMVANTDGVAEYLKRCREFYVKTEHLRLAEAARIAREQAALDEAKKKLGVE